MKNSPATAIRTVMPPMTPLAIAPALAWPECGLDFEAADGYVEDEAIPHVVFAFVTVRQKMACKAV
jgi:hypothetical protein